jgi:hypothetical protein
MTFLVEFPSCDGLALLGQYGIYVEKGTEGSVDFKDVTVTRAQKGGLQNNSPQLFNINKIGGNQGW